MEQIYQFYKSQFDISDSDWDYFSSKLKSQSFTKKQTLLKSGQTESFLSFLEKGIVRFYIPGLDQELTFAFGFEGQFISAYDSFITQAPCEYDVQALTDGLLWRLTYEDLQDIYQNTTIGNLIGRKASEDLFFKKSKRELSLLKDTAETRYLQLFTERPEILQKVPLKYVASYIGITPQALSRIRKRIS